MSGHGRFLPAGPQMKPQKTCFEAPLHAHARCNFPTMPLEQGRERRGDASSTPFFRAANLASASALNHPDCAAVIA